MIVVYDTISNGLVAPHVFGDQQQQGRLPNCYNTYYCCKEAHGRDCQRKKTVDGKGCALGSCTCAGLKESPTNEVECAIYFASLVCCFFTGKQHSSKRCWCNFSREITPHPLQQQHAVRAGIQCQWCCARCGPERWIKGVTHGRLVPKSHQDIRAGSRPAYRHRASDGTGV